MMPTGMSLFVDTLSLVTVHIEKKIYLCVTSLYDSIILVILIKFIYFPFEISLVGGISPIKTVL